MVLKPEEEFENPNDFYNFKECQRYNSNSGMKNIQEKMTTIALDLIDFKNKNKSKFKILDVGCGSGFSLDLLQNKFLQNKKDLYGVDPSFEMINITKQKGYTCEILGFEDLNKLQKKYFNFFEIIISISALNWVISNKSELEIKNIIKKVAKNLYNLLKINGKCAIQFYPGSYETYETVVSAFNRSDFIVDTYIYNSESRKKRKYFVLLSKD